MKERFENPGRTWALQDIFSSRMRLGRSINWPMPMPLSSEEGESMSIEPRHFIKINRKISWHRLPIKNRSDVIQLYITKRMEGLANRLHGFVMPHSWPKNKNFLSILLSRRMVILWSFPNDSYGGYEKHCALLRAPINIGGFFCFVSRDLAEYITSDDCHEGCYHGKLYAKQQQPNTSDHSFSWGLCRWKTLQRK